jgi:hypothetical protein
MDTGAPANASAANNTIGAVIARIFLITNPPDNNGLKKSSILHSHKRNLVSIH